MVTSTGVEARLEEAHHQKEELELKSAKLVKEWDLRVVELEANARRLAVIMTQTTPVDPRVLRGKAQRDAQEIMDSRIAECIT
ncbi:uncharacterized protein A4U43_C05F9080 [Asparagus officinalis]|uniref:Uncharacterized protein n=1 Tax=Asparagus officinalis TaxID=4686 RepID=A0A5P1ERE9_ASPOF|nr:uncharacterized protein A4U43_C05F9080 [Asparagus officinalis]